MKILTRMLASIFFITAAAWLILMAFIFLMQEKMIFIPSKGLTNTPGLAGLPYEEVYLTAADQVKIHGWFIPHPAPRATLLFFHGNAGNISHRIESIRLFHKLRLSVFIIDYRGYGMSEGRPSEQGTYQDARAAWDYLVEERALDPEGIIIFGRSLGGGVAGFLAKEVTPGAVILESTFTSIRDMAKHYYPYLPVGWMARIHYPTDKNILSLTSPVLVIHSEQDNLIPVKFARRLYDMAPEPKMFVTLYGGHNEGFLLSQDIYMQGLEDFISAHFDETPQGRFSAMR